GDYIFVTSTSWNNGIQTTDIISFRYVKGKITAQAGNTIKGYLNNSFSLDEYQGYLRVVSTYWDNQKNYDINNLFIMDKELKTVGSLVDIGDTCYFVTFRQTDPLFSVDLSDPKNPKMLGELKITGFSEYLHPYGDNLLLGIGWEVDSDTQENLGLKLSMFDISDPANVVEKDKMVIKNVYNSPAMDNYKAVMIDPEKNLFGFAYQTRLDDNYEHSASSYSLFSYDRKNGFTSTFTTSLNQTKGNNDYYSDYYSDLENIRGLYIKNTFYLATLEDIQSYNMNEDYAQTGKVTW
ncbi:MAG: beta-propeller domain-containing protein, partial [Methanobacterium sp.]|nr:beta-propeller domain-containing protein [Methanobacterium sp.]